MADIRTKPATDAYRKNFDRVFKKIYVGVPEIKELLKSDRKVFLQGKVIGHVKKGQKITVKLLKRMLKDSKLIAQQSGVMPVTRGEEFRFPWVTKEITLEEAKKIYPQRRTNGKNKR